MGDSRVYNRGPSCFRLTGENFSRRQTGSSVRRCESHKALQVPLLQGERVLADSVRGDSARYQVRAGQSQSQGWHVEELGSVSAGVCGCPW